jgi:hypothetical protein
VCRANPNVQLMQLAKIILKSVVEKIENIDLVKVTAYSLSRLNIFDMFVICQNGMSLF